MYTLAQQEKLIIYWLVKSEIYLPYCELIADKYNLSRPLIYECQNINTYPGYKEIIKCYEDHSKETTFNQIRILFPL